jgi:hypothetical protein
MLHMLSDLLACGMAASIQAVQKQMVQKWAIQEGDILSDLQLHGGLDAAHVVRFAGLGDVCRQTGRQAGGRAGAQAGGQAGGQAVGTGWVCVVRLAENRVDTLLNDNWLMPYPPVSQYHWGSMCTHHTVQKQTLFSTVWQPN